MRRILSAIANALRSTVSFVWDKCAKTGQWTLRQVAGLTGGGGGAEAAQVTEDVPAGYASAADVVPADDGSVDQLLKKSQALLGKIAGEVRNSPGDGYDRIKRLCADEAAGLTPWHLDFNQLSHLQQQWHECLTPEMVRLVGAASREEIVAHMKGGKGIDGVIRCDKESLAGWKHSVKVEQARAVADMEVPDYAPVDQPAWAQGRMSAC